jgi:hypothetical protein
VLLTALPYDDVVRFIVRDTGRIPAELQREIFGLSIALASNLQEQAAAWACDQSPAGAGDGQQDRLQLCRSKQFWVELPMASKLAKWLVDRLVRDSNELESEFSIEDRFRTWS